MTDTQYQPPSRQSHFLVTGGGKGITAANAVVLAKAYQARFTLIGRSSLMETEPVWAEGLLDEASLKAAALTHFRNDGKTITPREIEREVDRVLSSREIKKTLETIEESGGTGEYIPVDITDAKALAAQLGDRITDIDGLIHGAGALADKYIQDKTEADFDLVYGVKIGGIKNILQLIRPSQLKYLVLFSSVAGFYGNSGQADYSTANEILNKLAHHLKQVQPDCQVISIGWGPWDGGMVTPQLKRIFERKNIPLISLDDGTAALIELLASPQENPQVVIGDPLPAPPQKMDAKRKHYTITRKLSLESNPFLADHVIGGNAVLPTVCAVAWFINVCESLYPGFQFFAVHDYRVFKGIVFEEPGPNDYILEIEELEKGVEKLIFVGKISSITKDNNDRFHYQAEIEFRKTLPERPRLEDYDLSTNINLTGRELYDSGVLFHGPSFQGVEKVLNISAEGITTICQLQPTRQEDMGQFPIINYNPILVDVHLQSLLIWAHHQKGTTGLPLRIGAGIQYHKVPDGQTTYATMRVKSVSNHKLVAEVISHDEQGLIYSKVVDAEITLNDKLMSHFQQNKLERERV